jgi:NAD(P)-dependent dehydrogenase (short-subunit alcohol dehydrogenase family)
MVKFSIGWLAAGLLPVLIILHQVVEYAFQVPYTVHAEGIVVISGASTGIGRHAAEALAQRGFHVFAGVRKESDAKSIEEGPHRFLHSLHLDVTNHESVVNAMQKVQAYSDEHNLPLVALVNNAGVNRVQTAEFHELNDARQVFETNFFGALDLVQQSLPALRKSKGRILMISSLLGFVGAPLSAAYSGSKFAMEGMSDSLRREVSNFGISVSVVQPGFVKTSIHGKNPYVVGLPMYSRSGARVDTPAEAVVALYPHIYNDHKAKMNDDGETSASSVDVTTAAIVHAVMDKYPRTRYVVASAGLIPAWVGSWIQWMFPDRVDDFILSKLA